MQVARPSMASAPCSNCTREKNKQKRQALCYLGEYANRGTVTTQALVLSNFDGQGTYLVPHMDAYILASLLPLEGRPFSQLQAKTTLRFKPCIPSGFLQFTAPLPSRAHFFCKQSTRKPDKPVRSASSTCASAQPPTSSDNLAIEQIKNQRPKF